MHEINVIRGRHTKMMTMATTMDLEYNNVQLAKLFQQIIVSFLSYK